MTSGNDGVMTTEGDGMEMKRTYSLVDVAERLGRARTTLADWSRQFRDFLPTVGTGRSMRYTEEAVEVFGLISKMKDANEPPEAIREQLRGMVREIIVTPDGGGQPYLMQLSSGLNDMESALRMMAERLTKENDGMKMAIEELRETQRETAAAFERAIREDRSRRLNDHLIPKRIERQLEREALDLWDKKPGAERMKKIGLFKKEEDVAARDRFIRNYVDEHYEQHVKGEYGL